MKTRNTIQKAIEYLSIYATKSDNFDNFKFIDTSIDNPLKVSYIKQDKIDSLLDYTGTKIKGTKEQRKKYFTSTSINKILSAMFIDEREKTETISTDIDKQLRKNYTKNVDLFFEDDVKGFYSQENKNYIYNNNGSCMNKKPITFFEIYDKFINVKTQIVGLKVGKSVVARAILWTKTFSETHSGLGVEIESIKEKAYFLDRIYISNEFQNSNQSELQSKLYNKVKRALNIEKLDCYSLEHIISITKKSNPKAKFNGRFKPFFDVQISQENFFALEHYPFMDSFRWGKETDNNIIFSYDEDSQAYILESTEGYYTENGDKMECAYDGCYYYEDDMCYSDIDDCYYYEDNCTWIEERETYANPDEVIYNSYSGHYHYQGDLDC